MHIDAEALYPSLDIAKASRLIGELIRESGLSFDNIDWTWAARYVALAMNEDDVVRMNSMTSSPGGNPDKENSQL